MNPGVPSGYDPRGFPPVGVTVDVVLFAIQDGVLQVLLIERGVEPFRGSWALPGGFVQPDDPDLDHAAARELEEETGIGPGAAYLEQLATYGAAGRDPRMRVISVAYWAACAQLPQPRGGSDAVRAELLPLARIEDGHIELAFDHRQIVQDAVDRLRAKLEYTAVGVRFCGPAFTISELREVYEVVWSTKLDAGNFQRKVRYNGAFRVVDPHEFEEAGIGARASASSLDSDDHMLAEAISGVGRRAPQAASAPRLLDWSVKEPSEEALARHSRGRRLALASPDRRGGRPASLWTAEDPGAMLDSPIARPETV